MRVIETLLGIVDMKRADGLALVLGEVPALLTEGGRVPLTMPALSVDMMAHVLTDCFSHEERKALDERGTMETVYRSEAYGSYAVHAQTSDDRLALTLRRVTPAASDEARAGSADGRASIPAARKAKPEPARAEPPEAPRTSDEPAQRTQPSLIDAVLEEAIARRASDVIVSTGRLPLLRIDGVLAACHDAPATFAAMLDAYLLKQLGAARQRTFQTTGSADFSVEHVDSQGRSVRLRANAFKHAAGVAVAFRPVGLTLPRLAELNLPASLTQLVEQRTGLVLFTGPTGSGKSTTLAALIEHVNQTRAAHIVTLEDPIEYVYRPRRSIVHQREVGQHVDSFASGLRAALRENPDVLLVGEMRDPETIRMALTASQTGHLVLSTLHSGTSVMAIERIVDAFPESEKSHVRLELAASLRQVVAQQLVSAARGGRVPALEILSVNHAIASQIRDGRTHLVATQLETGADEGMVPMTRSLANLVRAGHVTRSVALAACDHREMLERLLDARDGGRPRSGA